jgi:FixJ family two-component response regulator
VPEVPKLSPREREVVQLLGEDKTTKQVTMMLNVTVKTAETHRSKHLTQAQASFDRRAGAVCSVE